VEVVVGVECIIEAPLRWPVSAYEPSNTTVPARPVPEIAVTATDAYEFGPPETPIDRWAALVLERNSESAELERATTFENSGQRGLEISIFRREGCLPADIYVRYMEQGPLLYRINIEVPPNTPKKRVLALMRTFFDAPRGAPSVARVLAKPSPTSHDPC
jgi:hypothetical protein